MTKDELKHMKEMVKDVIRPIGDMVEVLKMKVSNQGAIVSAAAENVRSVKEQQSVMNEKLTGMQNTLDEHTDKLDALLGDVMDLQDQTKAIHDKIGLGHTRNKREIDETKTHLGLPLMSNLPAT